MHDAAEMNDINKMNEMYEMKQDERTDGNERNDMNGMNHMNAENKMDEMDAGAQINEIRNAGDGAGGWPYFARSLPEKIARILQRGFPLRGVWWVFRGKAPRDIRAAHPDHGGDSVQLYVRAFFSRALFGEGARKNGQI